MIQVLSRKLKAPLRSFVCERRGNVAMMSAVLAPVLLGAAAFAVDEGSLYFERRQAQAATDLAAITAAANVDKAGEAALSAMGDNGQSGVAVANSEEATGHPPDELSAEKIMVVETGTYTPDPELSPDERFAAGGAPGNAARVTFRQKGSLYFAGRFTDPPVITTSAIAAIRAEAAFSVGSRLASINDGLLNTMLGALIGSEISLKAMDYRALLDTDVEVLSFLNALSQEIDLKTGTYNDVLDASATIGQVFTAAALAVDNGNEARIALLRLADAASRTDGLRLPLSHLLELGAVGKLAIGHPDPGLDARLGIMQLVGASAAIANRDHQVQLGTEIALPGILGVSLDLAIGEPPQLMPFFAIGEAGAITRTAQTRLLLEVRVGGPGGLLGSVIQLPVLVELGYAEAKLQGVACSAGEPQRVAIDAQPGLIEAWIGEINPQQLHRFDRKPLVRAADLVSLPVVKVKGSAHVMAGNMSPSSLVFDKRDIRERTVKTVSTRDLSQPLIQSLLNDLDLEIKIGMLGIGIPSVSLLENQLAGALGAVTGQVDSLIYSILTTLGVRVGEADIRVNGVSCHRAVLVN